MLHFHDRSLYIIRGVSAWCAMQPDLTYVQRELDSGYCLDAVNRSPAGSTRRIEPLPDSQRSFEPFASPSETRSRDIWGFE